MRKLKKFTLAEGHELSAEEMAMLEGGDFIPFSCNYPHLPAEWTCTPRRSDCPKGRLPAQQSGSNTTFTAPPCHPSDGW